METTSNSISFADGLYARVTDFYNYESGLLDGGRHEDWLNCLAENATYTMPVRMTLGRDVGNEIANSMGDERSGYYDDTKQTLARRLSILAQNTAWGEVPASRTRRFITNLRLFRVDDTHVKSVTNLLFTSMREAEIAPEIIICERHDTLICDDTTILVTERRIYCDNGAIPARALSIPI